MAAQKKYPDELKAEAIRIYQDMDPKPTIRHLAQQLGVHHEALRYWLRRADIGRTPKAPTSELAAENERLREQVAHLQRENDILRSASTYFAIQLGQNHSKTS
ncbi:transposase [Nocardia sp. NPDC052316]|uniref:transposase n=1 Tax=Nocardia sp. NPDC052316 TaxID=3364329 RepID=UPI0037C5D08D